MGEFVNRRSMQVAAWLAAACILGLNVLLVIQTLRG